MDQEKLQKLLERAKARKEEGPSEATQLGLLPWNRHVEKSKDLERILRIPRREWTPEEMEELAQIMTPLLAKEGGEQTLRPVQAVSLHDLASEKGLISTARVGAGKTLITLLAAYVVEAVRPLIVVPANLKKKTIRDIKNYRKHWEIAEFVRVESYEWLSRKKQLNFWEDYRPDLVMCDEAHKLRDTSTATVKRLRRYLTDIRPQTILGLLSGTLTNRSLKDFWHLLRWTLPYENCPLPHNYNELDMWSLAVDEKVSEMNRVQPGALIELCDEAERDLFREDPIKSVRLGIQRRMRQTPGIVTTRETFEGASLQISAWDFEAPKPVRDAIDLLRVDWETPGSPKRADGTQEIPGYPLSDATELSQHEKEMALGFYYILDPPPPDDWLQARKQFCKSVRSILRYNNRKLDTESQVIEALDNGFYSMHMEHLDRWREVKDDYDPEKHKKTVWIDDFAVKKAAEWMKENNGIVWVFHTAFGKKLSQYTGVPYYAGEGLDAEKNFIEDHPADKPLIASMHANREGKNLQKWHKNLMTFPHTNGGWWEQLLGRTHRDGQEADTVYCDMFYVTEAHLESFYRAKGDAKYIEEMWGQVQKMLYADLLVPAIEEVEYGELLREAEERGYETGSDHHTDGHGNFGAQHEGTRDHSDRSNQAHPS
jgi:hypothetical protein